MLTRRQKSFEVFAWDRSGANLILVTKIRTGRAPGPIASIFYPAIATFILFALFFSAILGDD
jgi:hypothetical protein